MPTSRRHLRGDLWRCRDRRRHAVAVATALVVTLFSVATVLTLPATPAVAAATCSNPGDSRIDLKPVPWAQKRLGPANAWPFSTGTGVTVAVIDTGVDATHPHLAGQVLPGVDLVDGTRDGTFDCDGHGTGVASLIAGKFGIPDVGMSGFAPGAKVLPIRVIERAGEMDAPNVTMIARVATAIDLAVAAGAKVINISLSISGDYPPVKAAIEAAIANGVLVVAAAGNDHDEAVQQDPPVYPAGNDGVLAVGSVDQSGLRSAGSRVNQWVDLVAPGGSVLTATLNGTYTYSDGTSFAAAIVSASAALVFAQHPGITGEEVAHQLIGTASNTHGGPRSDDYGHGEVDPYRAVTQELTTGPPVAVAAPTPSDDREAVAWARYWSSLGAAAGRIVAVTVGLLLIALVVAVVVPRGGRRGWRSSRAPTVVEPDRDQPSLDRLFAVPTVLEANSRSRKPGAE